MKFNSSLTLPPGAMPPGRIGPSSQPPASNVTITVPPSLAYTEEPQQGSVLDYWRIVMRRKGVALAFALAGAAAGCLFSFMQSPVFRARTTLEVQDISRDVLNKSTGPADDPGPTDAATDIQTQLQIIQSETLIDRTLSRLHIESESALNPPHARISILPHSKRPETREDLIHAASKDLKATASGQTRMIDVSFQSSDPKVSASFANTLVDEFIQQNIEARWQMNKATSEWLTQQLDEMRNNLRRSDDALQDYARKEGLIYTADRENVSSVKLRQLQSELSAAQADRVSKESRFRIANAASPDTLADVLNDNGLRQMQANITDLRRQEADLGVTFKPDYTKLQRLRAEISSLESARDRQRTQIVSRISNDFQEAEDRERMLADAYDGQVRLVMADSQKSIQYDILKRDVDTNRQIYESMLQRVKESGIASALRSSNVRIIDAARIPEKPVSPIVPLNMAGGAAAGLILGMVAIVLGQRSDRRLRQPGDAGRLLGLRELGVIPKADRLKRVQKNAISVVPGDSETDAIGWHDLPAGVADSFRSVLASIVFSRAKDGPGILVITSAGPMEGKTTTATNLAVALSNAGNRVLLIDGDTRKPAVHAAFRLPNNAGVTDLLREEQLDAAVADGLIHKTAFERLEVLPSGPPLPASADLLFSTAMPGIIAHFRERYDMILIDTPPLLHMPDARVLARMSDAVVLVARAGRTLREAARAAYECLAQDRSNVMGVILNDWNPRTSPDGMYGNYSPEVLKRYSRTA